MFAGKTLIGLAFASLVFRGSVNGRTILKRDTSKMAKVANIVNNRGNIQGVMGEKLYAPKKVRFVLVKISKENLDKSSDDSPTLFLNKSRNNYSVLERSKRHTAFATNQSRIKRNRRDTSYAGSKLVNDRVVILKPPRVG